MRSCLAILLLVGCAKPVDAQLSATPPDLTAVAFSSTGTHTAAPDWWTAFQSPELDTLMVRALAENPGVQAAYHRLTAANATVVQARSPLFPALAAEAGIAGPPADTELAVGASYEVDLWGRIRAEARGAAYRRDATATDASAAALSLSGAVARTWVGIAASRAQLTLLDRQVRANEGMAKVVEARFLNGVVRQADSLRQQRLLVQTEGQRIVQRETLAVQEHALAALLGLPATAEVPLEAVELPPVPPLPETGLPAEVIRRRPDVRAAEQRLRAVDEDVAVAVAERFPRLTLGASVSTSITSSGVAAGWVASLSANLVAPLFEAGARRAAVQEQRALLDAALADYGAVVVTAVQEVEDALARDRLQAERVANLQAQARLADRTADGLEAQYTGGLDVGYLDVLTARTTAQQLRRDLISAHQRQLELRIAVYLAIAGGLPAPENRP